MVHSFDWFCVITSFMKKHCRKIFELITSAVTIVLVVSACAPKESLEPMYESSDYTFKDITLNIPTVISEIDPVEPTGIRRFIYKIPILNRLVAIPFDLTNALMPQIPLLKDVVKLSDDDTNIWADHEFLRIVKSLKITKGWLRQKSDEEVIAEGHDLGKKKSWLCQSKGIEFIKEMNVKFQYQDHSRPHAPQEEFPIAYTNNSKKYFKESKKLLLDGRTVSTKMFTFEVLDEELVDYIGDVNNFGLKLQASGKIPCERVFLEAGIEVRVVISVPR